MNPLEALLALLRGWRERGAVLVDDEVRAPHAAVAAFDAEAFGRLARGLSAHTAVLTQTLARLDALGADAVDSWSGIGGSALAAATRRAADELRPAVDELAAHAREATAAHDVLGEVFDDYRAAMAQVTGPLVAGLSDGQTRQEIAARLDLAAAAGRVASRAVDDTVAVLHDSWRAAGSGISDLVSSDSVNADSVRADRWSGEPVSADRSSGDSGSGAASTGELVLAGER